MKKKKSNETERLGNQAINKATGELQAPVALVILRRAPVALVILQTRELAKEVSASCVFHATLTMCEREKRQRERIKPPKTTIKMKERCGNKHTCQNSPV